MITNTVTGQKSLPPVLDVCCGSRMFWFDRADKRAVCVDKREGIVKMCDREWEMTPDVVADFTNLPFEDETFLHVVFDPPHRLTLSRHSYMAACYGKLETGNWRQVLRLGFAECFRVLRPGGTLIFKWCDRDIKLSEVLRLTPEQPLYGHRSGRAANTHWVAFLKATSVPDAIPAFTSASFNPNPSSPNQ